MNFQTPGIYFERPRPTQSQTVQRTDIAGFVGVAERGPLHSPVRLVDWRDFQQVFGGFLPYAHLAYAVYSFFQNGGQACWVVRVADAERARQAWVEIPQPSPSPQTLVPTACTVLAIDPGTWGEALSITLLPARLAETRHVALTGLAPVQLAVERLTGLYPGSRVSLTQPSGGGNPFSTQRKVVGVNALTGVLTLDAPLGVEFDPGDPNRRIVVESLEFTLLVRRENEILERFDNLGFEPAHLRYALDIVNQQSRQVRLKPEPDFPLPQLPWEGGLRGGLNGLRTLDALDYAGDPATELGGLAALAKTDEVAILLIPDLVMQARPPSPAQSARRERIDPCALDQPLRDFVLHGVVTDAETSQPLPGVQIQIDDGILIQAAQTGLDGGYSIGGLLPIDLDLTVTLAGYEQQQERIVDGRLEAVHNLILRPIDLPPALSDDDVFTVQEAMISQCERLRDRFAILDSPLRRVGSQSRPPGLDEVIAWRQRFDTAFAALYYPWLIVRDPAISGPYTPRLLPPSGHVAGVYAATDLSAGVFRAPANRALTFVDDLSLNVDDNAQGALNPIGINAIRAFPGRGIRIFGARTLAGAEGSRYVNERRFLNQLIETLYVGLQWAVFEPINTDLQSSLRLWITRLLDALWRQGALVGGSADEAYQVVCDDTTTPPEARDEGRLIGEVLIAPTTPYEFILLRLGFTLDELTISEV